MAYSYDLMSIAGLAITVKFYDGATLVATDTPTESLTRPGYYVGSGPEDLEGNLTCDILVGANKIADDRVKFTNGIGAMGGVSPVYSFVLGPVVARMLQEELETENFDLIAYEIDPVKVFIVLDAEDNPVILTEEDLVLICKRLSDGTQITITSITINANYVTVTFPATITDTHGKYSWVLRHATTRQRYGSGFIHVREFSN